MSGAEAIPRHATRLGGLRLRVAAVCVVLFFSSPAAYADVTLAPSTDGYVGAWLGVPLDREPVDYASIRPALGGPLSDRAQWLTWSLVDGGTDSLDLNHALGDRRTKRILLASVLSLGEPLDGLLLLSVDGGAKLAVDGRVAWSRSAPHGRGRAWDPVPLALGSGDHVIALELERTAPTWNLDLRLLSRADLEPPPRAAWMLPGAGDADADRLLSRLVRIDASVGLVPSGYQPRVRLGFPRGAPAGRVVLSATYVQGKASMGAPMDLGTVPTPVPGASAVERMLPAISSSDLGRPGPVPNGLVVHAGPGSRTVHFDIDPDAPAVLTRAVRLIRALGAKSIATSDPDLATATIEQTIVDLGAALDAGDPAARRIRERLGNFVKAYESGVDPRRTAGVLDLARRSRLDGAPEPFELHVPSSYRPEGTRRYPLVVLLHGYDGTPERIMTAFLGSDSKRPRPGVDGFILAPSAHGNAFYRGPGETDLLDSLDWVMKTYPIDPDRVSIAGHSMGGTGAAEIGLHYADRFSSIASLAGYHSYFVRRDVIGRPLRTWEWAELCRYSPASFAENGRDLPLYVAQGTHDLPLSHTKVLAERYQALGYSVIAEFPEIGHDVWKIAWEDLKQWPVLASRKRVAIPKRVTLKTDSLRRVTRAWATIVELERAPFPGTLDAKIVAPDRIAVTTRRVTAFRLERPAPHVPADSPVALVVDGTEIAFEGAERLEAHRSPTGWSRGPAPPKGSFSKHAGLEGPIREAFTGPLLFVYGTLDPHQTRAAREVAEHFRARYSGNARFEVMADVAAPRNLLATRSIFLVGSSAANAVTRRLDASLPFGITGGGVRMGSRVVTGDAELGVVSVYPSPLNPSLYIVVLEATEARGLYRSMSLPLELPDFVVFDSGIAAAAGEQVLGDAHALFAGYFDGGWALPADARDVIAVPAGRDGARWNPD